jgi:hypothetical protein
MNAVNNPLFTALYALNIAFNVIAGHNHRKKSGEYDIYP